MAIKDLSHVIGKLKYQLTDAEIEAILKESHKEDYELLLSLLNSQNKLFGEETEKILNNLLIATQNKVHASTNKTSFHTNTQLLKDYLDQQQDLISFDTQSQATQEEHPRTPREIIEKLTNTIDNSEEQFRMISEQYEKDIDEKAKRITILENDLKNLESKISGKINKIDEFSGAKKLEIEEKVKWISDLNEILSNKVIAGHFEQSAERERRTASWLRFTSIALMVGTTIILGITLMNIDTNDLHTILFRIGLVFAMSIPATYVANESNKHRRQEYEYRQMDLELKSINPFLDSLPDETKHELKKRVSYSYFLKERFDSY